MDQFDDPHLGILGGHAKLVSDHFNIDFLMDAAERLENQQTGVFFKISVHVRILSTEEEEIDLANLFALVEPFVEGSEIHVDVDGLQEHGHGIGEGDSVGVDVGGDVLELRADALGDDGDVGDVTDQMRGGDGDDLKILVREEHVDELGVFENGFTSEDHEECPVQPPNALREFLL